MAYPGRHGPKNDRPRAEASAPAPPASEPRGAGEILWGAGRPLRTRQIHDAIARRHPHRAGRKISITSSLLAALLEAGWLVGRKRGWTRWAYEAAVSRNEARRAVEALSDGPGDGWYLV